MARFRGDTKATVLSGSGDVTVTNWKPRYIEVATDSLVDMRIALRQFAYTGWFNRLDDDSEQKADILSRDQPVVVIAVPAGRHHITVSMPQTRQEKMGWVASMIGLVILVVATVFLHKRRHRPAPCPA